MKAAEIQRLGAIVEQVGQFSDELRGIAKRGNREEDWKPRALEDAAEQIADALKLINEVRESAQLDSL